jgi:phosphoribosylformylglycinamidine synthase subunit PurS
MKAYVYVSLKRSVLDPQGKTIQGALQKMGYKGLADVRQGKFFELTLDGGLDRSQAEAEVERIARDVLTNPVIEEFRYHLEDKCFARQFRRAPHNLGVISYVWNRGIRR